MANRVINAAVSGESIKMSNKVAGAAGSFNAVSLVLTFDSAWDDTTKKIYFFDAYGNNAVYILLTADLLSDGAYIVPIPAEPLVYAGEITITIKGVDFATDGTTAERIIMSASTTMKVLSAISPDSDVVPIEPTPTQAEQLQGQIDVILVDIVAAAKAANSAEESATNAVAAQTAADTATAKASEASASATVATNAKAAAEASKTAAALSEANALSYKNTAVTQATNAGNSASEAAASATAASISKTEAETAKAAAANSALSAAESATDLQTAKAAAEASRLGSEAARDEAISAQNEAAISKTLAFNSAEDAEAYGIGTRNGTVVISTDPTYQNNSKFYSSLASTAKTAAESAKTAAITSEANAKTSETNAATSATNAASSASSASGSKADALASKNAAATSASNAATSETKAKTSETNAKAAETGAIAAKTAAESAKSIAVTAKDNAVLAKTAAETAQGLAETAKSGADAAKSGADTAKAGAETARDTAITAKNDAVTAKSAAQTAKIAAETAKGLAETARTAAQASATTSGNRALDSEAFGAGTRNGAAVTSGDSAYQNNAKWYKDQAGEIVGGDFATKIESQGYANTAEANANAYTDTQISAIPPIDISGKADKTYVDNKVKTDVPVDAKFTDTVYTHPASHPASMITGLPASLPASGGNADTVGGFTVGVNVPSNAKFTDTVYSHPTSAGNKHIPTGGASGQVLKYSASGTATWQTDSDTITTVNGKTGAIVKADIVALGIPAQDTVVDISGKADKVDGKGLSTEDYTTVEKTKLAGIADNANNYSHPATHPASMITQTASNRFVTDTEKSTWNGKANAPTAATATLSTTWTGSGPYTQNITVSGVTSTNNITVSLASTANEAQRKVARDALLSATAQATNSITITADGDKPTVTLPIQVLILGG